MAKAGVMERLRAKVNRIVPTCSLFSFFCITFLEARANVTIHSLISRIWFKYINLFSSHLVLRFFKMVTIITSKSWFSKCRKNSNYWKREKLNSRPLEVIFFTLWIVCNLSMRFEFLLNSVNPKFLTIPS